MRGKVMMGKRVSRTWRAGLQFSVPKVRREFKLKLGHLPRKPRYRRGKARPWSGQRFTWCGATYTAAVLEYLTAELAELAGNVAKDQKKVRVTPRHVMIAVFTDQELADLLKNVTIPCAGVIPRINPVLLPKATPAKTVPVTPPPKKAKAVVVKKRGRAAKTAKTAAPAVARAGSIRKPKGITLLNERQLATRQKLTVISGDIVDVECDAIVNPSNNTYNLSGQVGSRLHRVGGAAFQQNINQLQAAGNLEASEAGICEAVNTAASHVIHVNGPSWGAGGDPEASIAALEKTVQNCLKLADAKKLKSICMPSIGSGVAKFPKQTAAQTILRAIAAYFKLQGRKSTLKHVFFVLYDQESINVYTTELGRLEEP